MFTGLIELAGDVAQIERSGPGARLVVRAPPVATAAQLGESIAVSGCCLTVVRHDEQTLSFDVGPETLARTTLGELRAGSRVNLEKSLKVGDPLGGHFVTGHIDGVGSLAEREDDVQWSTFWIEAPAQLIPQMASKGSIAVDGVSLTLVDVSADRFSVALIPHTLTVTTLGQLRAGSRVNLETDLLAKYVERQIEGQGLRAS